MGLDEATQTEPVCRSVYSQKTTYMTLKDSNGERNSAWSKCGPKLYSEVFRSRHCLWDECTRRADSSTISRLPSPPSHRLDRLHWWSVPTKAIMKDRYRSWVSRRQRYPTKTRPIGETNVWVSSHSVGCQKFRSDSVTSHECSVYLDWAPGRRSTVDEDTLLIRICYPLSIKSLLIVYQ